MSIASSKTLAGLDRWSSNFFQKRWVLTVGTMLAVAGLIGDSRCVAARVMTPPTTEVTTQLPSASTTIIARTLVSLANGTEITPSLEMTGSGTLKVINGTRQDAAIKLVDRNSGQAYRFVYVQARREVVLNGISSCLCTLKFTTGTDWDTRSRKFRRNASFSKFEQALDFREIRTAAGVRWVNYTATLHPVSHGKARTNSIRERDF
jgi:hypothetical protein